MPQFCLLAYHPAGPQEEPESGRVVALVTFDPATRSMLLSVRTAWETIVQPQDRNYIRALFIDLEVRSGLDPAGVFQQVSSLSVGPIITFRTGTDPELNAESIVLGQGFVRLTQ